MICLITYIIKGLTPLKSTTELIIQANEMVNTNKISLFFPPVKKDKHKKSPLKKNVKKEKVQPMDFLLSNKKLKKILHQI